MSIDGFLRRFGVPLEIAFCHVPGLVADGLAEWTGTHLRLTACGFRHAGVVSATFS